MPEIRAIPSAGAKPTPTWGEHNVAEKTFTYIKLANNAIIIFFE
jgi:hypothetical protein